MRRLCFVIASLVVLALTAAAPGPAQARDRGADGKFEKRTSPHFVLFQDVDIDETSGLRGSRRFEQQVLQVLEAAYDRLDQLLGLRPERPITVTVYDPGDFDARFSGLFRFPAAGFYGDSIHIRGDIQVHTQLVGVLHHELVHAALHAEAPSLLLPAWLNEGLSEWFEARALGQRQLSVRERQYLGQAAAQGSLFSLAQLSAPTFARLDPRAVPLAYLQSYAFVDYLARAQGERRLRDFCRELLRTRNLDSALRKNFRSDFSRLEAGFLSELAN